MKNLYFIYSLLLWSSTVFASHQIPGTIEAESYDTGGEGVAYHSGNGGFGTDGCSGATGGSSLNNIKDSEGDWINYTIENTTEGDFNILVRLRYGNCCGKFTLYLDDVAISGQVDIENNGWDCNTSAWAYHTVPKVHITAGNHVLKIEFNVGNPNFDNITILSTAYAGTPNNPGNNNEPHAIPGDIEAEHFDNGGQGVASSMNVTTENNSSASGGKWITNFGDSKGDWVKYTISVAETGYYTANIRLRYGNCCGKVTLYIDDVKKTAVSIPETGNWDLRDLLFAGNIFLETGNHVLKLEATTGHPSIDKITFTTVNSTPYNPGNNNEPHAIPGAIEAEHFDNGGQGVAYYDTSTDTPGNGNNRGEHVGIENSSGSNGKNVCYTAAGEWLKYTFTVAETGRYDIRFTLSNGNDGGKFSANIDDTEIAAEEEVPNTGWGNWENVTIPEIELAAGTHVLTFKIITGGFNFDKIQFPAEGAGVSGAPAAAQVEINTIAVQPVSNTSSNGQTVEYAIAATEETPGSPWQAATTFSGLQPGTAYYVFARTAANDQYKAGAPQHSNAITTLVPQITVTTAGLTGLKAGTALNNAKITYTLSNTIYAENITPAAFAVTLPGWITAEPAVRLTPTIVEIALSGTPEAATTSETIISNPVIPAANITGATDDITPGGTITIGIITSSVGIQTIEANNNFHFDSAQNTIYWPAGQGNIKILDLTGKKILSGAIQAGKSDISSLPQGIYIVQAQSEGKIITGKIVKH
jgi:hypothetical protein